MVDLRDITEEYSLLFSCLRHCHKYQEEEDFSLSVQHISALLVRPKFNELMNNNKRTSRYSPELNYGALFHSI